MKVRSSVASVLASVMVATLAVVGTLIAGNEPLLGLDLQGGVQVVLQPVGDADEDRLDQAVEIIRRRVDSLGVAEPEITTQDDTIVVALPGIADTTRALDVVGQTAELRFRPVLRFEPSGLDLSELDPATTLPPDVTTLPGDPGTTTLLGDPDVTVGDPATTLLEGTAPATTTPATTAPATTAPATTAPPVSEVGLGMGPGELAGGQPPTTTASSDTGAPTTATGGVPTTTAAPDSPTTVAPGVPSTVPPPISFGLLAEEELTSREEDTAEATVILAQRDDDGTEVARYELGPAAVTGEALTSANPQLDSVGAWAVVPVFKAGSPGIDDLNVVAAQCVAQAPQCPTGQLAIVLDGEVISAPGVQQPSFERDSIQISGEFSEKEARDLARVLKFGALPLELEPQAAQVVSATVGEDALRAGIVAGLAGLALVTLVMALLYRALALVAVTSLTISAGLLFAIVAWLGETRGLALTLAGVTGLIVSIGVSLDSNIVYFEHLKEDIRNGRTLRSAVDRSFAGAFRTIVAADTVSLIGAAVLYTLTLGAVRGFALYLGLATLLDLAASWFFMRPAVMLMGRWPLAARHPGLLGLPSPDVGESVATPVSGARS